MIRMFNTVNTDMTGTMDKASLPLVYVSLNDEKINIMRGVTGELEVRTVRGYLTPLTADRKMSVIIDTFGGNLDTISYEVRSINGERLIERTEVLDYIEQGDSIKADLNIKDLIREGTEYMLVVLLDNGAYTAKYYTRIIYGMDLHEKDMVSFVSDFSDKTFNKQEAQSLVTYLESNAKGDNSTFDHVNINSSLDQVTWGNLRPEKPASHVINILDMDGYTATFNVDYTLSVKDENYKVREYYRLRYTDKRIYLLDYERDMDEYFTEEASRFVNDKIVLGIRNEDVNMAESVDGRHLAFEQNGSLYTYRESEKKLVRVFSFEDKDEEDIRTRYDKHWIKILRVGESGSVFFAVYGYMNRGRHEGDIGVSLYNYDASLNQTDEEVYIKYPYSAERLKTDVNTLFFYDGGSNLSTYLAGNVYRINIEDRKLKSLAKPEEIVVSESNRMAAVLEDGKLRVLDFYSNKDIEIDREGAHPLGFIGEDFVYGVAEAQDVVWSIFGSYIEPMSTVYIENGSGEVLKTYSRPGVYVIGAEIGDNEISLKCISKSGDRLVNLADEEIMHNSEPEKQSNTVLRVATEDRETITEISLFTVPPSAKLQLITPKEVIYSENRNVVVRSDTEIPRFYTFAKGQLSGVYNDPVDAINEANDQSGVAVDENDEYIWRKGRGTSAVIDDISLEDNALLAQILNAVLLHTGVSMDTEKFMDRGKTALEILNDNIDGNVLSLSGCPLSSALYYISKDAPLLASYQSKAVLITGYDADNVIIMDGSTTEKMDIERAAELFESSGNDFVSYVLHNID